MTSKLAFVGRFLAAFAVLIVIGWGVNGPQRYGRALQGVTALISPVTSGWWLSERPGTKGPELYFRRGSNELRLLLSLESLSLGLLPLLALFCATPGIGWRRGVIGTLIGAAAFFTLDVIVVLLYPLLVSAPNAFTDILGTFLGLLTFVGAPIILWFALTFDLLRPIWRLEK